MSICSKQYAARSLRDIGQFCFPSAAPEPLLFLYPKWFRIESTRRYHTEHRSGPDSLASSRSYGYSQNATSLQAGSTTTGHSHNAASSSRSRGRAAVAQERCTSGLKSTSSTSSAGAPASDVPSIRKITPRTGEIASPTTTDKSSHYLRRVNSERIFELLKRIPRRPPQRRQDVETLSLPREAIEQFSGHGGNNSWFHHDGSGCSITVLLTPNAEKATVELQGSERAREIAKQYLSSAAATDGQSLVLQAQLDWQRRVMRHGSYTKVYVLQQPPVWSVRSFLYYVRALTQTRYRRSAMRLIYHGENAHHLAVAQRIEELFADPKSNQYASTEAFRVALWYFVQHTELNHIAVRIWNAFHHTNIQPSLDCYNHELGRCLVTHNDHRIIALIDEMVIKCISPNGKTWALVLRYANRHYTRIQILRHLKATGGLDDPEDKASVADAFLKTAVEAFLKVDNGIGRLIDQMSQYFGPDIMTPRILTRLLRACRLDAAHDVPASDILAMISHADSPEVKLDEACVLELIRIAKKAGNLPDALELVKSKPMATKADIPQEMIEAIFFLAWKRQSFNVCRLFWFIGATLGRITWNMQQIVRRSLGNSSPETSNLSDSERWSWLAGKVVVGTDLRSKGFSKIFPHLFQALPGGSPLDWLLFWSTEKHVKTEQAALADLLIERDLNAWRRFDRIPRTRLVSHIDRALAHDKAWVNDDFVNYAQPAELIKNSIKIPLLYSPVPGATDALRHTARRKWFIVNDYKLSYDTLEAKSAVRWRPSKFLQNEENGVAPSTALTPGDRDESASSVYSGQLSSLIRKEGTKLKVETRANLTPLEPITLCPARAAIIEHKNDKASEPLGVPDDAIRELDIAHA